MMPNGDKLRRSSSHAEPKENPDKRVVVIEFDDIAKAVAAHDAAEYQTALKLLGDGADRDIRIVEGAA